MAVRALHPRRGHGCLQGRGQVTLRLGGHHVDVGPAAQVLDPKAALSKHAFHHVGAPAHLAVHDPGLVLVKLAQALAQLGAGDVYRAGNVAQGPLGVGAHVQNAIGAALHVPLYQRFHRGPVYQIGVAADMVGGQIPGDVHRILGGSVGRSVGQL